MLHDDHLYHDSLNNKVLLSNNRQKHIYTCSLAWLTTTLQDGTVWKLSSHTTVANYHVTKAGY